MILPNGEKRKLTEAKENLVRRIWVELVNLDIANRPLSYTNVWVKVAGGATYDQVLEEAKRLNQEKGDINYDL